MNDKVRKAVKKIGVAAASLCTGTLVVGIVVYAWFNHEREIAKMQKVKAPDMLYINAAHAEDVVYFKLSGIEYNTHWKTAAGANDEICYYKDYVFSVSGEYVDTFTLQLAHTTNNEFSYQIFEAERSTTVPTNTVLNNENEEVSVPKIYGKEYIRYEAQYDKNGNEIFAEEAPVFTPVTVITGHDDESDEDITENATYLYYTRGDELLSDVQGDNPNAQKYLNPKTGSNILANRDSSINSNTNKSNDVYKIIDSCYGDYSNFEDHAMPLYWQCTGIDSEGDAGLRKPFYREFILHVEWNATQKASTTYKETDIIYLTAKAEYN